jgi:hypothetical protein
MLCVNSATFQNTVDGIELDSILLHVSPLFSAAGEEKHLHRYLSEFDFRYSNRVALGVDDEARSDKALKGIAGKRLTYRDPTQQQTGF